MAHWYTHDGALAPALVPYADPSKGERRATLRDAKRYGWAPSVTTVLRVLDAPALGRWKVNEAVKRARALLKEHPEWADEPDELLTAKVASLEDTTRRDLGTEIHRDIQLALLRRDYGNQPIVDNVLNALDDRFPSKRITPLAERPVRRNNPVPYGGQVDLILPGVGVVDFKTKDVLSDRMVYDEHVMQVAAYCQAADREHNTKRGFNLFVDYSGDVEIVEHSATDLERGWEMFRLALKLWYLQKRWTP